MHPELQHSFLELPSSLKKLVLEPCFTNTSFDLLETAQASSAARAIQTKTLLSLLRPPSVCVNNSQQTTEAPLILVFCQPSQQIILSVNEIYPFVPVSYCSWLQAAGARCVPLPYNINQGSMQLLLEASHGLLVPGGGSNLYKNYEAKEGFGPVTVGFLKVWRFVSKLWAKGIHYPVWGTCLGLQIALIALTNDVKILSNLNSKGHELPIYSEYHNSRFLGSMPPQLRLLVEHRKLLNFSHMHGLSLAKYTRSPKLKEKLRLVSIAQDKDAKWFCAALQGRQFPLFLSQFHPQKQGFQWAPKGILHNKSSIEVSQYLAAAFVQQCRKSRLERVLPLETYTIKQYCQVYTPQKLYKVYAIDYKFRDRRDRKSSTRRSVTRPQKTFF